MYYYEYFDFNLFQKLYNYIIVMINYLTMNSENILILIYIYIVQNTITNIHNLFGNILSYF